jgi:hypothetical protein
MWIATAAWIVFDQTCMQKLLGATAMNRNLRLMCYHNLLQQTACKDAVLFDKVQIKSKKVVRVLMQD